LPRKIISASRRSDIAAFYSRWLLRRLEAGTCDWIHPFTGRLERVSLRPEDCLSIVFWTRNPAPLFPALADLEASGHFPFFHVTAIGYPKPLESHNPELDLSLRRLCELAERVGPEAIVWRYDPIVLSSLTPPAFHLEQFASIARRLEGAIRRVYFSFVDPYGKTRQNFERLRRERGVSFLEPDVPERKSLALRLRDVADRHGMTLYACCEDALVGEGVEKGRCIDLEAIRRLRPDAREALRRRPTREQCGCSESVDIGAYDTCAFGCSYCYATRSREAALARLREHDPDDSLLWRPRRLRGRRGRSDTARPGSGGGSPGAGSAPADERE
jgi:hypothetical protein